MASLLRLGDSIFSRLKTPADYTRLLKQYLPNSNALIIKVDWVGMEDGSARDLETLQCLVDSAKGKVIVTESHQLWRPKMLEPEGGLKFTLDGKEVDWDWFLDGEGWRWLINNPDWGWFINGPHWSHLMKEERLFLEKYGYYDFFKDNGVEYVNATDEIWAGRTTNNKTVKEAAESRYPPAFTDKVYGFVPDKLYKHRGSPLVSLSKRKDYQSFTMKNMFGFLPDPVRAWWHGLEDKRLDVSILDINKVYGALFELVGIFEALHDDESVPFSRDVAVSRSIAQLDAMLNHVTGFDLNNAAYVSWGNKMFGTFDSELLKEAQTHLSNWFPLSKKKKRTD